MLADREAFARLEEDLRASGAIERFEKEYGPIKGRMMITRGKVPDNVEVKPGSPSQAFIGTFDFYDAEVGIVFNYAECKPLSGLWVTSQKENATPPSREWQEFFVQTLLKNIDDNDGGYGVPVYSFVNDTCDMTIVPITPDDEEQEGDPMKIRIKEISTKDIEAIDPKDILAVMFGEDGAMGEPGAVNVFMRSGAVLHANYCYGMFNMDRFIDAFEPLQKFDCGIFGHVSGVPKGWHHVWLGMGNHLLICEEVFPAFAKNTKGMDDPGLFNSYMGILTRIIKGCPVSQNGITGSGMSLLGAAIGDIVGSVYEFHNHKSKSFELFKPQCFYTDDTVMTLAVAEALVDCKKDFSDLSETVIQSMRTLGGQYPHAGYGGGFAMWLVSDTPEPYNSFGNGAAMRVSPVAYVAESWEQVKELSRTEVTHSHPEGIKGAEATAACIWLALRGVEKEKIATYVQCNYYDLDFTIDEIREKYSFNETCQDAVPQAIRAFLESKDFEDAIRIAISVGGDSDTLAAITGSIAEAYYGIPVHLKEKAWEYLDEPLRNIYNRWKENLNDN